MNSKPFTHHSPDFGVPSVEMCRAQVDAHHGMIHSWEHKRLQRVHLVRDTEFGTADLTSILEHGGQHFVSMYRGFMATKSNWPSQEDWDDLHRHSSKPMSSRIETDSNQSQDERCVLQPRSSLIIIGPQNFRWQYPISWRSRAERSCFDFTHFEITASPCMNSEKLSLSRRESSTLWGLTYQGNLSYVAKRIFSVLGSGFHSFE
jgi:hypothetical protein